MNDTIYILQDPKGLSYQHPVLYILYTYGFYRLGVLMNNPNAGLALLSVFQMVCMDYVLTYAIALLHKNSGKYAVCVVLTLYFGVSPLFATYAVSAIKDTPFSIAVFMLMALLYEAGITKGKVLLNRGCCVYIWICLFVMVGFRSNGLFMVIGTFVCVLMIYREQRGRLAIVWGSAVIAAMVLSACLMPRGVDKLFQEKVGIPIQQVAAVINKGTVLTSEQETYLYRLLPEEKWKNYAPGCSDIIKWDEEFDRVYLNDTRKEFMQIWLELMPHNPGVYMEAYIMNTYGVWGIETRNSEQYYFKDIYQNELGLYQDSPLPNIIYEFFYRFYCNRYTYCYLSAGTAFWVMFAVIIWLISCREYAKICAFVPMICCFISLLLAIPIAFAFRYVYVLAMAFPFYVIMPFLNKGSLKEAAHDTVVNNHYSNI